MTVEHALVAARAASSKTLDETTVLVVGELLSITDHFVIASGHNDRQVSAIVDEVTRSLRDEAGLSPRSTEGQASSQWVLLDYGDFVVHVFGSEARSFYALERLWSDAPKIQFEEIAVGSLAVDR